MDVQWLQRRIDGGALKASRFHGDGPDPWGKTWRIEARDLRRFIRRFCHELTGRNVELEHKDEQLQALQTEISEARRGSEEAGKRSDMLLAQITNQLDRAQNQLEDFRTRPSFWQRVVGKKD